MSTLAQIHKKSEDVVRSIKETIVDALSVTQGVAVDLLADEEEGAVERMKELQAVSELYIKGIVELEDSLGVLSDMVAEKPETNDWVAHYDEKRAALKETLALRCEENAQMRLLRKKLDSNDTMIAAIIDDDNEIVFDTQMPIQDVCPITKVDFVEPVRNTACGHCYSRAAIESLFQQQTHLHLPARVACPVTGCSKRLDPSTLVPAPTLLSDIKRRRREEAAARKQTGTMHDTTQL